MSEVTTIELDGQYRQLREECGLLDRSDRGKLAVSGPDAAEYLQSQVTNDVEALAPGAGQYAALLDRKGHMQSDMRLLHTSAVPSPQIEGKRNSGAGFWIDTEALARGAVLRHLTMYSVGRDVVVDDVTDERAILSLIGPRSAEIAATAALAEYASEAVSVAGVDCLAVGTRDGIDLIVGSPDSQSGDRGSDAVATALLAAGANAVAAEVVEVLRIESGTPRFGFEMSSETMPAEAGIVERAVDFEKGCYIGQEPVARLHYRGKPNRHLRGLELSSPAEPGAALRLGEKEVGRIGSACLSPARGPIALAIVRREAEPGAELTVGEDGVTARVVDLPFG
jgi:folate-binding protein YgfZ